jgi:hypothetical protein
MKTSIPAGTLVKTKRNGQWEYSKVVEFPRNPDGTAKGGLKGMVYEKGDDFGLAFYQPTKKEALTAVKAVWKGITLEAR